MAGGSKKKTKIPLIGLLALKNQLVTKSELEVGLTQVRDAKDQAGALKDYFISQELISNKNVQRLTLAAKAITIRQKEYTFGAIALAKGFINKSVLDLALEDQQNDIKEKKKPRLIGDMMVAAGLLTERQRDYILKLQNRVRKNAIAATVVTPDGPAEKVPAPESSKAAADPETGIDPADDTDTGAEEKASLAAASQEVTLLDPEIITGGIQLQVSSDFMAAFLTKTDQFDDNLLASDIKEELIDRGIVAGIVAEEMIDGFIQSTGFKTQSFRVAKGIRPIQGQDAKVEFFFNTDYLKAGGMDDNGYIDFKQRGEIPLVDKGTVLAEKIPRVEARWGQNIYGDEVMTEKGEDTPLRFGHGVVLSEDGLKLLADVRGYPKYSLSGVVFVHEEYTAGGDVDYETGHIEFDGNVNVKGCIKSGFKVRGNDVTTVELDGGIIEAEGDVKVDGGINEGSVYARGNVYAKFIHNSEINCMGDVYVQKEIVDSTIETSGSCSIANGKLISSTVTAKMGLMARNIGTEMGRPSVIKVGHDAFTQRELKKNKAEVARVKEEILGQESKRDKLKEQNTLLQKEITELAHVQDRAQLEQREIDTQLNDPAAAADAEALKRRLKALLANVDEAENKLDHCFEKSEALESAMKKISRIIEKLQVQRDALVAERNNLSKWAKDNPGKAMVAVEGALLAGTQVIGKHSEYTAEKEIRHARISELLFKTEAEEGGRTSYQMQVGNY